MAATKPGKHPFPNTAAPQSVAPQPFTTMRRRLEAGASVRDEVAALLDRSAAWERHVHALLPDENAAERKKRVLAEVERIESAWPDPTDRPPLFGALVGVKDLFHASGFPTRAGSQLPAEAFSEEGASGAPAAGEDEARCVAALRAAGAVVLAKTVSTEFAYFAPGPTTNPWNTKHTPGGSSSGSAAAVAAGMCHIALGTQTIGSITRPASFCGVTGLKPSFGRVSTAGAVPFSPDADHVGPIAADVSTLIRAASVLLSDWRGVPQTSPPSVEDLSAAPPHPDFRHVLGPVLVPDDAYTAQGDEHGRRALDALVERLLGLGVDVQRIAVFGDIADINAAHRAMIARDFAEVHTAWFSRYADRYHPRSRQLIEEGRTVSDGVRDAARRGREELRDRLERALQRHGAKMWLAPATVGEAPKGLDSTGDPVMNLPWTYSGLPTVNMPLTSIPHGFGPGGLPLGVQAAGFFNKDEDLLAQALLLEHVLS